MERDPDAWCRDTLTRLAALRTLSRNAGEGLLGATGKPLSSTVYRPGRGGTQSAGWVGEGVSTAVQFDRKSL